MHTLDTTAESTAMNACAYPLVLVKPTLPAKGMLPDWFFLKLRGSNSNLPNSHKIYMLTHCLASYILLCFLFARIFRFRRMYFCTAA